MPMSSAWITLKVRLSRYARYLSFSIAYRVEGYSELLAGSEVDASLWLELLYIVGQLLLVQDVYSNILVARNNINALTTSTATPLAIPLSEKISYSRPFNPFGLADSLSFPFVG
jgi:hypothetical protein